MTKQTHSRSSSRRLVLAAGVLGSLCVPVCVHADVLVLTPNKDTTIYGPNEGDASNSLGTSLFVGYTIRFEGERRALLAFDVSSIPCSATINSVTLSMTCTRTSTDASVAGLHRVLAPWSEGTSNAPSPGGAGDSATPNDPTWQHSNFPAIFWTNLGGDFDPIASGTTLIDIGSVTFASSAGMVADVARWIADPASNYGWMIVSPLLESNGAKRLSSRENANASQRPRLTINYTPCPDCSCSPCPACPADYNQDGGITGDDIAAFFADYENGEGCSDANQDGGITGDDIAIFFLTYEAGGC